MPPEICPNCGAIVPPNHKSCPECGADEETGWADSATADRLGIPHDDFNYDEFVKQEFGPRRSQPRGISWIWWVTALVLLGVFLLFYFH